MDGGFETGLPKITRLENHPCETMTANEFVLYCFHTFVSSKAFRSGYGQTSFPIPEHLIHGDSLGEAIKRELGLWEHDGTISVNICRLSNEMRRIANTGGCLEQLEDFFPDSLKIKHNITGI